MLGNCSLLIALRYILFEWMTLLYRVVPPHVYVATCVAAWGLIASLQCLVSTFTSLLVLRALLGISEAAFGPGVPFYLSFFYRREELAFRTGLFISAAPLATSFASSLAWLIVKVGSHGPISPWRLLFLVEGFPSVFVAFFVWLYIPDSPRTAKFLNTKEKKIAEFRLLDSGINSGKSKNIARARLQWKEIGLTLLDPKSYITAMMFFSCNVAFSSLPPFLPTIIKDMHYSPLMSQALSAPPYLFAFVVVIFTTWESDRRKARSPYLIFHSILGSLGYAWLALSGHLRWASIVRYAGTFAAAAGFFSAVALTITWTMDNRHAAEGKGTGVALMNLVGQLGPLVGTRLYPDDDAPYYVKGMSICAAFMLTVGVLTVFLWYILRQENMHLEGDSIYEILRDGSEPETSQYERTKHETRQNKVLNIL